MNRPYVVLQVLASADGRISLGPNRTQWDDMADSRQAALGSSRLWDLVANHIKAAHKPQADLLGSSSLVKEGASLSELPPFVGDAAPLYQDFLPEAVVQRPGHEGWLVVVDGRGRLRSGYRGDGDLAWHMLHLASRSVAPEYLAFLQHKGIPYLVTGETQVNLGQALTKLKNLLGVETLLTAAGGRLAGALMRQGLIDEINIIYRPVLIGGTHTPTLFCSPELGDEEWPLELEMVFAHVEQDSIWVNYKTKARVHSTLS